MLSNLLVSQSLWEFLTHKVIVFLNPDKNFLNYFGRGGKGTRRGGGEGKGGGGRGVKEKKETEGKNQIHCP